MRLAIVNLTSGGMSGGYRKYLQRLIPLVQQDKRIASVEMFLPHQLADQGNAHSFRSRRDLVKGLASSKPDVVFIPTARHIETEGIPTVVMLRNMEPVTVPFGGNPLSEGLRNLVRREAARRACSKATRVLAVSRHVQDVLVNRWDIPSEKIGLVYHGVEAPVSAPAVPEAVAALTSKPFLFTAGSIRPARGLEDVIGALAILRSRGAAIPLVVAGAPDPATRRHAARVMKQAERNGLEVYWLGKLTAADMSWCFTHCRAFVMTSRAEACPNTALEAMSHGALCLSTDTAPMPEFFEDVAYYYPARDAAGLAQIITDALAADAATTDRMRESARARAGQFTWEKTAARTVDELCKAAAAPE